MRIEPLPLGGCFLLESAPFTDHRGAFARLFCANELAATGLARPIVQINHSRTTAQGAIRGMHFQRPPHAETKIVRCLRGAIFDVAVDLRPASPTFLRWHGELLTPDNMRAMCIPEGFAHGFQCLKADSELLYLHTEFYMPDFEGGLRCDDPAVGINWPLPPTDLSDRDRKHLLITPDFQGIIL